MACLVEIELEGIALGRIFLIGDGRAVDVEQDKCAVVCDHTAALRVYVLQLLPGCLQNMA